MNDSEALDQAIAKARQKVITAAFAMVDAVNHNDAHPSADGSMDADYRMDLFIEALNEYAELKK